MAVLIVGITGTFSAGKGEVVKYLVNVHGLRHYSVRGFLEKELERRGIAADRDAMTMLANEMRAEHGPGYIVGALYEEAAQSGCDSIIESIRNVGEIELLKSKGPFKLIAVDADQERRWGRARDRGSNTDDVSFEKFREQEEQEMRSVDPNKQNLSACIKLADFVLKNNGTLKYLYSQVDDVMRQID